MFSRVACAAISSMWVVFVGVMSLGVLLGIPAAPTIAHAQAGPPDLLYRIERLENQVRQLTGEIEQLQYRNQQLEAALNEARYQDAGARSTARVAAAPPIQPPAAAPPIQPGQPGGPGISGGGRRSDAFDPAENPYAPGAPRALGSTPPQPPPPMTRPGMESTPYGTGPSGGAEPGYRSVGQDPGYGRPPAGAAPYGGGSAVATASPPPPGSGSPREIYDAGTAYLQRRDYAAAEEAFRDFLRRYPSDRLAAEAQFNLGESLFQRQSYQDAADAFVQLSKRYENSAKAPDALLRLGQSLAALNEKELACVAFADVGRKYPRAQPSVKQAIERELKRARC